MTGRHRAESMGGGPRGGLRPLTVLALCCVIAVLSVMVTEAVGSPKNSGHGTAVAAQPDDGTVSAESADGPTDQPADPSSADPSDTPSVLPSDPATPTTGDTLPAAPDPAAAPPPAPPGLPDPPPGPSPTAGPPTTPVGPPSPSPTTTTRTYEAEWIGNTMPDTRVYTCSGCSGGKKVGNIGRNMGTLQFNGIRAVAGGRATVKIAYVNGDSTTRIGWLSVNGCPGVALNFPVTGGWSTVRTLVVTLTLKPGGNTLQFFNNSGAAPDFDKLTVTVA